MAHGTQGVPAAGTLLLSASIRCTRRAIWLGDGCRMWGGVTGAHLDHAAGDAHRVAASPVAGGVDPQPLAAVALDDVGRALRGTLGIGIQRHARPVTAVEDHLDGMLLDVIDQHPAGGDGRVGQGVQNQPRALALVLQMRGVHQDQLIEPAGEVDLLFKDGQFVAAVFVQADLADSEHVRLVEERGDQLHDFPCERGVFRLLGVDAEPTVVGDAELGRPLRFDLGQLAEVIVKPVGAGAIEPGPESRLGHRDAAGLGHALVVVGGAADHVNVRIDVGHGKRGAGYQVR